MARHATAVAAVARKSDATLKAVFLSWLLSVTDVLWLTDRVQKKTFYANNQLWVLNSGMQNFSHLLQVACVRFFG